MRTIVLLIAALAVASCGKSPLSTESSNNPDVAIDKLFTHEGVTVYRFVDGGRYVYFTAPPVDVNYSHSESCGKGCTRDVRRQTLGQ